LAVRAHGQLAYARLRKKEERALENSHLLDFADRGRWLARGGRASLPNARSSSVAIEKRA